MGCILSIIKYIVWWQIINIHFHKLSNGLEMCTFLYYISRQRQSTFHQLISSDKAFPLQYITMRHILLHTATSGLCMFWRRAWNPMLPLMFILLKLREGIAKQYFLIGLGFSWYHKGGNWNPMTRFAEKCQT